MQKPTIMVVEDHHIHRSLISRVLEGLEVNTTFATNMKDETAEYLELDWVIEKFEKEKPEILIIDIAWTNADTQILAKLFRQEDISSYWLKTRVNKAEPQVFKFLKYLENKIVLTIILTNFQKEVNYLLNQVLKNRGDRIVLKKPSDATFKEYQNVLEPAVRKCINANHFLRQSKIEIISDSLPTIEVYNLAMEVANTDATILITGETGIGKTYLAKAIHTLSKRSNGPFIERNIAAIPHELLSSTLFGHEKGAFTGAIKSKPGILEAANGGTVFLDEIGDLPEEDQVYLLKAIEDEKVYPLGGEGTKPVNINVRYIFATNKNIEHLILQKKFRPDLFFRINVIHIRLTPLRERKTDIALFINYFLDKYAKELNRPAKALTDADYNAAVNYNFPGNVRQLKSIVYRSILLNIGIGESIKLESDIVAETVNSPDRPAQQYWNKIIYDGKSLKDVLGEIEQELIEFAEKNTSTNSEASTILKVSLSSYENKKRQAKQTSKK